MPAEKKTGTNRTTVLLTKKMNDLMLSEAHQRGMTFTSLLREIIGERYRIPAREWHLLPQKEKKSGKRKN